MSSLVSLPVSAGQPVVAGQTVAVVEPMGMQMGLRAPQSGRGTETHGAPGRSADQGKGLVILWTEPCPARHRSPGERRLVVC